MEVGLTKDSLKTLLPMTGTDANQIGEVMMEFANSVQECPCPPSCLGSLGKTEHRAALNCIVECGLN